MYIATKYIGGDYTPGEVLPDDLDKGLLERLIKSGAVKATAPEPVSVRAPEPKAPKAEEAPAAEEAPEAEAEEIYEEPEAPEVDVTEALVGKTEPKTKSTRKGAKGK